MVLHVDNQNGDLGFMINKIGHLNLQIPQNLKIPQNGGARAAHEEERAEEALLRWAQNLGGGHALPDEADDQSIHDESEPGAEQDNTDYDSSDTNSTFMGDAHNNPDYSDDEA